QAARGCDAGMAEGASAPGDAHRQEGGAVVLRHGRVPAQPRRRGELGAKSRRGHRVRETKWVVHTSQRWEAHMTTSPGSVDGKVALVTGVSSGIGQAIATELGKAGYRVFGTVRSGSAPLGIETLVMDVRDQASVDAAVRDILDKGHRIDVLVNNAGAALVGAIEETDTAQAQALFDVNFFGAARVTQAVLPTMRAQGSGRIVFISSILGFLPHPFMG